MSTLSNAAARPMLAGTREKAPKARRARPVEKSAPKNIDDPLGDFSEQTGAQFG